MRNIWKGGLTLKNFFRVINGVFLALALIAAGFLGYKAFSYLSFPTERYDARVGEIYAQAAQTREEAETARQETADRLAALRGDLRQNGEEAAALADSMDRIGAEQEENDQKLEELNERILLLEDLPGNIETARKEYALKIRELEEKIENGETDLRICYWTLDDGPTYITGDFLDALDRLGPHVHVTFFAAREANESPNEKEMLRRELASGHSVQNHSYDHTILQGESVYRSLDSFREQVQKQDDWIYEMTGLRPGIFRFPGGYYTWAISKLPKATEVLDEMGYKWIDWNCNLYDSGKLPTVALTISRAVTQASEKQIAVILGHEWNENTLSAMESAIPMLQEQGFVFLPLFPESLTMGMEAKE